MACVAMVASWKGITTSPDALVRAAGLPTGVSNYTFNDGILAASMVGLKLVYRSPATWEDLLAEGLAGRPTIPLIRYGELSGNQDTFKDAHFIMLVGATPTEAIIDDPDWWQPRRAGGAGRVVPLGEFKHAIGDGLPKANRQPFQALFVLET